MSQILLPPMLYRKDRVVRSTRCAPATSSSSARPSRARSGDTAEITLDTSNIQHYLIGANWSVDKAQRWRGYGFSTIIGPDGAILATAKGLYGSEIIFAEIEVAKP